MPERLTKDLDPSKEGVLFPHCEAIIVLGRGVGKDKQGRWRPTAYYEQMKNGQHSGLFDNNPDLEDENTVVGGGNANTLATYHLFTKLNRRGISPKLIIFAAGRPDYLAAEPPEVSEGIAMKQILFRRLDREEIERPETAILKENKNTKDDIKESLRILIEQGIRNAVIITVQIHTERTREFMKMAKAAVGDEDIELTLIASEEILGEISPKYQRIFRMAQNMTPFKRTVIKEKTGVEAIRGGEYDFRSQGYTFSVKK